MITLIQFVIVFAAILIGVRYGGVALGFWGALGLIVLWCCADSSSDRRDVDHLRRLPLCILHGSCGRLGYLGAFCR